MWDASNCEYTFIESVEVQRQKRSRLCHAVLSISGGFSTAMVYFLCKTARTSATLRNKNALSTTCAYMIRPIPAPSRPFFAASSCKDKHGNGS